MGPQLDRSATRTEVHWAEYVAVFLLAIAYFLHAAWPSLVDPYVLNNDAPQHLLWMYAIDWGDSFYAATSGLIQPWGYVGLNRFLLLFCSADTLTRYGPLFSLLLTVGFAHGLLRRYFGWGVALGGALLIGHLSYPPAVGFFSRAFCVPVLLVFAYYWARNRDRGVVLALLAAALFYPPALLIQGTLLGSYFLFSLVQATIRRRRSGDSPDAPRTAVPRPRTLEARNWLLLITAALLAGGLVLAKTYQLRSDPRIGPFVTAAEIREAPEFGEGGRVNFVHELKTTTPQMLTYVLRKNLSWPLAPYSFYLAGLLWAGLAWAQRRTAVAHFDGLLLLLLASCCLWHALAQVAVPRLFVPDRFLSYPGHLLAGLFVVRLVGGLTIRRRPVWLSVVLLVTLLAYGYTTRPIRWESLSSYGYLQEVYAAVAEWPAEARVAAPPWVADMLPVFARRSVLLSNESAHALYFSGYRNEITPRWRDFITAYTAKAGEKSQLRDFLVRYGITHLVIDEVHLRERKFLAFQPFSDAYERATAGRTPADYLLLGLPPEMGRLVAERYRLVATAELWPWLTSAEAAD